MTAGDHQSTNSALRSDFFESRLISDTAINFSSMREGLSRLVGDALAKSTDATERAEYELVLEYLSRSGEHDSEGRDPKVEKRSFSRSELKVACTYEDRLIPKYLWYRVRFDRYPRDHIVPDFPVVLAIEPTSVCNLRCIMCSQSDPALSEDESIKGHMDLALFKRIIDEGVRHGLAAIVLASRGEPLLNRDTVEMVRYAKQRGILDVKLNTNATPLTAEVGRGLLEAGVDTLVFSVDSADKAEYERIRRRAKFEKVVRNIETFNEIRAKDFPNSKTRTRVSMVVMDSSQDVEAASKFWSSRVDEFGVKGLHEHVGIYGYSDADAGLSPCSLLWERVYVWWDGTVNPCSEDYLSSLSIGKLDSDTTIRSLWHSDKMRDYRETHLRKNRESLDVCRRCHGY